MANEHDGANLIANIRGTTIEDDMLAAEWAHDSLPAMAGNSARYHTTAYPGLTFHQHPAFGVVQLQEQRTASTSHARARPPSTTTTTCRA